ncbi:MAG: TetR/AcrR family transcriptional regulator [Acidobacteria bacterium]|nr:TetR/AcrR family transcriptional regulator [Acidobacteriota bacterium]
MSSATTDAARTKREARNERRREQTRTEILDAARDIVLRNGLSKFRLDEVAEELALTKPAIYYYFDSKEALLFELLLREWVEAATEVEEAVEETENGVDAVEQLMRTVFDRYRDRLELFVLFFKMGPGGDFEGVIGPEELERIRPINDMLYGGAEKRLRADQRSGDFPGKRDPRRFAFTAHMAVIGLLNMKAIAASADDPLIHGDDELIDDLCTTFRDATLQGGER